MKYFSLFIRRALYTYRIKNFCGSIADSVQSKSNTIHVRYFAEAAAINSSFGILYTAYRDKGNKGGYFFSFFFRRNIENLWAFLYLISYLFTHSTTFTAFHPESTHEKTQRAAECRDDEYDCEDQTCIKDYLKCNNNINCRFRWDEDKEKCKVSNCAEYADMKMTTFTVQAPHLNQLFFLFFVFLFFSIHNSTNESTKTKQKSDEQSEHVFIIVIVFGVMLTVMAIAFVVNCMRKIMRDHKIIRVSKFML